MRFVGATIASDTADQLVQSITDQVTLMCRLPYTSTYKVNVQCIFIFCIQNIVILNRRFISFYLFPDLKLILDLHVGRFLLLHLFFGTHYRVM